MDRELETVRDYTARMTQNAIDDLDGEYTLTDALEAAVWEPGWRIEQFIVQPRTVTKYITDSGSWERTDADAAEGDVVHMWMVEAIAEGANCGGLGGRLYFTGRRQAASMAKALNAALAEMDAAAWSAVDKQTAERMADDISKPIWE